jgi:tetratricopeptide (TPR) repeat protein
MSRTPDPRRFCPSCRAPTVSRASFCAACGAGLPGGSTPWLRPTLPAAVVLAAFFAVGLGLWVSLLAPGPSPQSPPPAGQNPSEKTSAGRELPPDHPPIPLPGDVAKLLGDLERQAEAVPNDVATWKRLADREYRAARVDKQYQAKAEKAFRHILELSPDDRDAIRGLGNLDFDRDDYASAITHYSRYLELEPKDSGARTDLGTMYLYAGDVAKAIAEYQKVTAAEPGHFESHFNLGLAYRRSGDEGKAKESLERARSLAPDERSKQQVEAALAGPGFAPPAGGAKVSFQQMIERALREHPIVGPKIVGFEWPGPTSGQVKLDGFPLEEMPAPVRERFLGRLEKELAEARTKSGESGEAQLALVDRASGRVMATVVAR